MACSSAEAPTMERPLSPVLNVNKMHRKILLGVRRNRFKINNTSKIAQLRCEILNCTDTTQRLCKLKQYEDEKRRLTNYFYSTKDELPEFDFKKPIPVKEFCRKSVEPKVHEHSIADDISVNFCESAPPIEGEQPSICVSNAEREFLELERVLNEGVDQQPHNAFIDTSHLINTIKNENKKLHSAWSRQKVVDFENLEIKLATKLLNKIAEANPNVFNLRKTFVGDAKPTERLAHQDIHEACEHLPMLDSDEDFIIAAGHKRKTSMEVLSNTSNVFADFGNLRSASYIDKVSSRVETVQGFATASGKNINISKKALSKANKLFSDDFDNLQLCNELIRTNLDITESSGFTPSAVKNCKPSIDACVKLDQHELLGIANSFSSAGGKNIKISSEVLLKANKSFDKDLGDVLNVSCKMECPSLTCDNLSRVANDSPTFTMPPGCGFSTASGKSIKISQDAVIKAKSRYTDEFSDSEFLVDYDKLHSNSCENRKLSASTPEPTVIIPSAHLLWDIPQTNIGFSSAIGKKIDISNGALLKAKKLFNEDMSHDTDEIALPNPAIGFITAAGKCASISEDACNKAMVLFESEAGLRGQDVMSEKDEETVHHKEMHNVVQIELKTTKINQNITTTLNDSKNNTPRRGRKRLGVSHCKQIAIPHNKLEKAKNVFNDNEATAVTPTKYIQSGIYHSTPVKIGPHSKLWCELNTASPIAKKPRFNSDRMFDTNQNILAPFVLQQQTEGNVTKWLEDFRLHCKELENKLRVMREREVALLDQTQLLENSDGVHKRQRLGFLSLNKQAKHKSTLQDFFKGRHPSTDPLSHLFTKITPKNAQHVHFNSSCFKDVAVVSTIDGARLIPNTSHTIGLAEIKSAFMVMPGVDPKLIPNHWIENHFKWIVWKLACYERSFTDCSGCLTVENVVQQLKYRYDREIDKAERSALRRILEKDDVPQKRMVLCVSDICKIEDLYELELCDGWYAVCTVVDQALCLQVKRGKIVVGTKLIMQYAELLNCDGCHPLEVPDHVRLKINYNCTRRAAWFTKLGYQHITKPFPISLSSIKPHGGLIGCIKAHIVRVYPVRFMEKQHDGKIVWRNQKAEEKYAQEWENEQMKQIEAIRNKIGSDYETLIKDDNSQTLQNSQMMTEREQQQDELLQRLSFDITNLQHTGRDVTPILKCKILDITQNNEQAFVFNIWKASEEHINGLKEGGVLSFYNVMPRRNGELAATARTHFKQHGTKASNNKMARSLSPIAILQEPFLKLTFNEFDSVGTVVRVNKDATHQELWLCDFLGRLLLIQIKEGRNTCCLFDGVTREQHIAVLNLIFCKPQNGFAQAVATQCSLVTSYPSQAFLQDSLAIYREQLPKDLNVLLCECDKKIDVIQTSMQLLLKSSNNMDQLFNMTLEDSMEIPTRLTSLDVAMSLIDMDKYL